MKHDIVFLEPNKMDSEPFTTSKVIAEQTGIAHKKIKLSISKYKNAIESFGLLAPYGTESTGGRPEVIYKLNEQQATFLMTLLKNTPIVIRFKQLLVKQFYAMREELMKRQINRAAIAPARLSLTDAIRDHYPDSAHKRFVYKHFQDLSYKLAFGKTAVQIRTERNAPKKAVAADYLTAVEMQAVKECDYQLSALITMGMLYDQIKRLVALKIAA